jgi:WG containing repeat
MYYLSKSLVVAQVRIFWMIKKLSSKKNTAIAIVIGAVLVFIVISNLDVINALFNHMLNRRSYMIVSQISSSSHSGGMLPNCTWQAYWPEGLIDKQGKFVLPMSNQSIGAFSDGLAVLWVPNEEEAQHKAKNTSHARANRQRCAYITVDGKIKIPAQFENARDFKNGRAMACRFNDCYRVIDTDGHNVGSEKLGPDFSGYSDGMMAFNPLESRAHARWREWGYLNITGQRAIEPRFASAGDFLNGIAIVSMEGSWVHPLRPGTNPFSLTSVIRWLSGPGHPVFVNQQYGVIDKSGTFLLKPVYEGLEYISSQTVFFKKQEKWGTMTLQGAEILPPQFSNVNQVEDSFHQKKKVLPSDGLAICRIGNDEFCFVNADGKLVIRDHYVDANAFSEGVAAVAQDGLMQPRRFFFIDTKGQKCIAKIFESARNFHEGLAAVKRDGKWTFIDKSGRELIPPRFTSVQDFHEDVAVCDQEKTVFLLHKDGSLIELKGISKCSDFSFGVAKVEPSVMWVRGYDYKADKPFDRETTRQEREYIAPGRWN